MGENGNEEMDYNVEVALKITLKNREFNCLLRPELQKDIIGFLNEINEGYIVDGSEEIQFLGDEEVIAKYDFCCNDVSPEKAENFARYKNATEYFFRLPNGGLFAMPKCRYVFLFSGEKADKT